MKRVSTRPAAHFTVAASALALALVAGCSAPEEDWSAIANGSDVRVGQVEIHSLSLVSSAESEPARILGMLFNESDEAVEVTIADEDDAVSVSVPAQGELGLDTHPEILDTADGPPGSRTMLTVTTEAGDRAVEVPVLDGTLEQYEPYVPTPSGHS
ncbi:hypothetical protein [Arthrobacter zhaoguopingii]|uniref:hypothetical protein n=1 Tax=Arthrobacter zhaoguopingii TaxID=2681491 RepID=UPI001357ACA5|nr:hypothetical protein [Arthrobacter zhaoguopingii]